MEGTWAPGAGASFREVLQAELERLQARLLEGHEGELRATRSSFFLPPPPRPPLGRDRLPPPLLPPEPVDGEEANAVLPPDRDCGGEGVARSPKLAPRLPGLPMGPDLRGVAVMRHPARLVLRQSRHGSVDHGGTREDAEAVTSEPIGREGGTVRSSSMAHDDSQGLPMEDRKSLRALRQTTRTTLANVDILRSHEEQTFSLHPAWLSEGRVSHFRHSQVSANRSLGKNSVRQMSFDSAPAPLGSEGSDASPATPARQRWCCLQRSRLLKPNSVWRLCLDVLGCALICCDVVRLPLRVFEPQDTMCLVVLSWLSRIFWTVDPLTQFFSAHVAADGGIEQSVQTIMSRYARTWLCFDLAMLALEWAELKLNTLAAILAVSLTRLLRVVKLAQFMAKVSQMAEILQAFVEFQSGSEGVLLVLGILRVVGVIAGITHLVACGWYGVSKNANAAGDMGWVTSMEDVPISHSYAVAFHWALTQFTGASTNVSPQAYLEYCYAIIAVGMSFIVAAYIVSTITTSMTHLQLLNTQSSRQFNMLNRYLSFHNISAELGQRIMRSAEFSLREMRRDVPEASVELLQLLSRPVRIELDYEVFGPTLAKHPFFSFYKRKNPAAIRQVCNSAVVRLTASKGDILFTDGESPEDPRMIFLVAGSLRYRRSDGADVLVEPGQWGCEACLWVRQWAHHGAATAASDCRLVCLLANPFRHAVSKFKKIDSFPAAYAEEFVEVLNEIAASEQKVPITEFNSEEFMDLQFMVNMIDPEYVERDRGSGTTSCSTKRSSWDGFVAATARISKMSPPRGSDPPRGEVFRSSAGKWR